MQVIKCSLKDLQRVSNFYERVIDYLDAHENFPIWEKGVYPSYNTIKIAIEKGDQYALEDNGQIIGALLFDQTPVGDYSVGEWQKDLKVGEYYIIHAFTTDYNYYKKGLGSFIMDWCKQKARRDGKKAIRVDVVPTNYPARNFYQKHGFIFAGEKDLKLGIKEIPIFALYEFLI